ncbi:MAG: glycosyltransferase family 4 protein [Polyangiales bacterium]
MSTVVLVSAFLLATLASTLLIPVVRIVAFKVGAVSTPGGRHIHDRAIPRLGGVAIACGFCIGLGILAAHDMHVREILRDNASLTLGLLTGGAIMSTVGVIDDTRGLRAALKLAAQIAVAVGAYAAGFRITAVSLPFVGDLSMGIFALPVTTIWIVGIVNAINLIDGLAAGVTFFAGITGLVVAKISGTPFTALMMATMLGAVLGFLFFNFNPARIFMGDSGSYFLGFVLAATSLVGSAQKTSAAVSILVPILALGVPILDTLFSIVRRFLERRSIFSPDRGHIHHRLLDMGITHRRAVFILYGFSFAFTAAAIAVSIGRQWQAGVAILGAAAGMLGIVRFVGYFEHLHLVRRQRARIRTRHTDTLRRVVPKLALALQEAETEDEVLRLFDEHLEDAEVVCCDIVRREGDDVERAWASPRFSSNRMVEYVSARFPLTEASSFDARFRWLSEFGEVSPQTEILLQLAVDLVISALQRTSSRYVPAPMQVAREERSFALAQRTGSV